MITVSILINGQPIYTRSAVNIGRIDTADPSHCYELDDGSVLKHKRGDGAIALAKMMLDTIHETKKSGG